MSGEDPPVGSVWLANHSLGEDLLLVTGEAKNDDAPRRRYVPCFVLTTGDTLETWVANFQTFERVL